MTFLDYQSAAMRTCLPQCRTTDYMLLGLFNETGELAGKVKKALRGDFPLSELPQILGPELGDCLWYSVGLLYARQIPVEAVAMDLHEISLTEFQRQCMVADGDIAPNYPPSQTEGLDFARVLAITRQLSAQAGALIADNDTPRGFRILVDDNDLTILNDYWQLCAELCDALGLNLEEVAQSNLDKLASRQQRATLQGAGDHR